MVTTLWHVNCWLKFYLFLEVVKKRQIVNNEADSNEDLIPDVDECESSEDDTNDINDSCGIILDWTKK